jgi:lipoate-protein ligase B
MDTLEQLGVPAERVAGRTGVFVDRGRSARRTGPPRKIASIGVGVRKWVTYHGFALNVTNDLSGFEAIVPCGLHDVEMTSVARELDTTDGVGDLDERVRAVLTDRLAERLCAGAPRPVG